MNQFPNSNNSLGQSPFNQQGFQQPPNQQRFNQNFNPNQNQPFNSNQQPFQSSSASSDQTQYFNQGFQNQKGPGPDQTQNFNQGFQNQQGPGPVFNDQSSSHGSNNGTHQQFYQNQQNPKPQIQNSMQQSEFVFRNQMSIRHNDFINPKDSISNVKDGRTHDEALLKESVSKKVYELVPKELQADLIHKYFDEFPFMSKSSHSKIQKNIQSQYRKSLFLKIIGDVIWERKLKLQFEQEWASKSLVIEQPNFFSQIKFQINQQGDERQFQIRERIAVVEKLIEALLKQESNLNLIGKCKARGNACGNQKNVVMEKCHCLAVCLQCFQNNNVMQALNICPVCGAAFGNRKQGIRCIF